MISVCAVSLALTTLAPAHVPSIRGHLVEWVRDSDLIVAGVVHGATPLGPREVETEMAVEATFSGPAPGAPIKFLGRTHLATGQRYVVFIQVRDGRYTATPSSGGGIFEAKEADDAVYRSTIEGIRSALKANDPIALRSVLIATLSAPVSALRYHAALELAALGDHDGGLTPAQRTEVEKLLSAESTDPVLRPFLAQLVERADSK